MRAMKSLLIVTALAFVPVPALAQYDGGGPGGMGGTGSIDPAGDNDTPREREPQGPKPLQRKKYDAAVERMFRAADTNHDGILTLAELDAQIRAQKDALIRQRFESIDTDRNQSISYAEFAQWQQSLGAAVFSDKASAGRDPGLVAEQLPLGLGDGRDDEMIARIIEPLSATLIVAANTDYDAGASLAEVLAYEGKRFDAADTNHDGWLTWDELEQVSPRRGGPGGAGGPGGPPPGGGRPR